MIKKLYEKFIVMMYTRYALIHGDIVSYSFMGEAAGEKYYEMMYNFFHKQYLKFGYKDIELAHWVGAGGYGSAYKHLLRIK